MVLECQDQTYLVMGDLLAVVDLYYFQLDGASLAELKGKCEGQHPVENDRDECREPIIDQQFGTLTPDKNSSPNHHRIHEAVLLADQPEAQVHRPWMV